MMRVVEHWNRLSTAVDPRSLREGFEQPSPDS